jgi:NADPH:quinone reductase-like Zn-dependent oxidoreductase
MAAMKAALVQQYGGPEVISFGDSTDPSPAAGEVLVRVAATSVNPIDIKRRSGAAKDFAPIKFPGIIGMDVAGTVIELGPGVTGWSIGDRVFGMGDRVYAELCTVKAENLAKVPAGIDLLEAAALPLVTTTGDQLITKGAAVETGQTLLVAGAVGSVGRSAVFTAKSRGATVIGGVRENQTADAAKIGADQVVAIDDPGKFARLPMLDAVADTVGGATAASLIPKVKAGGIFASVVGIPENASAHPELKFIRVIAQPDTKGLLSMAEAVSNGRLTIPISARFPLKDAVKAHEMMEKGGNGKILLIL